MVTPFMSSIWELFWGVKCYDGGDAMALPGYLTQLKSMSNVKGRVGEIVCGMELESLTKLIPCRFFGNVSALTRSGTHETQIDFVLLSLKGLFAIEVKNWYCEKLFVGNEADLWWQADYYGKRTFVKNPIIQNKWHTSRLSKLTGLNFESLILFSNSTTFVDNNIGNVMYISNLAGYITSLPDKLTEKEMIEASHKVYELKMEERC